MFRLALAFVLGLTFVSSASAQEDTTKWFYTKQECMPIQQFMEVTAGRYGESALFTGEGVTIGADGNPYTGGVMLLVNQNTGTWTMGTMYGNNYVCIQGAGTQFEPFGG